MRGQTHRVKQNFSFIQPNYHPAGSKTLDRGHVDNSPIDVNYFGFIAMHCQSNLRCKWKQWAISLQIVKNQSIPSTNISWRSKSASLTFYGRRKFAKFAFSDLFGFCLPCLDFLLCLDIFQPCLDFLPCLDFVCPVWIFCPVLMGWISGSHLSTLINATPGN